ncbi:penicillin-binding protein, partial [Candidatus Dojkabacteria bacterium]|nr:penicillin-binding protein [Candidatus Dojkabacteria bacterium]
KGKQQLSRFLLFAKTHKKKLTAAFILAVIAIWFWILYPVSTAELPVRGSFYNSSVHETSYIYDENGIELFRFQGDENRKFVALTEVPDTLKWSIIASEDGGFYQHPGFDFEAMLKCVVRSIFTSNSCGASTLTQQLVRNTLMKEKFGNQAFERNNPILSTVRKIREMVVAYRVERAYTKDEILELYINNVPLGGTNIGFSSASDAYLDKDINELNTHESIFLVALLQSPTGYNPLLGGNEELMNYRMDYIYNRLLLNTNTNGLSEEELNSSREIGLNLQLKTIELRAPHFVFYTKDFVINKLGTETWEHGGLSIYTTIDIEQQEFIEAEFQQGFEEFGEPYDLYNGGLLMTDPKTGEIKAMIGSTDFFADTPQIAGQINNTLQKYQMASSVKPFTYLTAIEKGYGMWLETPDLLEMDFGFRAYNFDGIFRGTMLSREALVRSYNIPALYVLQLVGVDEFLNTTEKLGIDSLQDYRDEDLKLTLGTGKMSLLENVQAYTTIANEGRYRDITPVTKITYRENEELFNINDTEYSQVFAEQAIYQINWTLCNIGDFTDQYASKFYQIDENARMCGKTGTSDGPRDLISIMYNPEVVLGIWMGNSDGSKASGEAKSGETALPLANKIITSIKDNYTFEPFVEPEGIIHAQVCTDTGTLKEDADCVSQESVFTAFNTPPKDKRERIYLCLEDNLRITNVNGLDSSQYKSITELNKTLENPIHQEEYNQMFFIYDRGPYVNQVGNSNMCKDRKALITEPIVTEAPQSNNNNGYVENNDGSGNIVILSPQNNAEVNVGDPLTVSYKVTLGSGNTGNNYDFKIFFDGSVVHSETLSAPADITGSKTFTIPSSINDGQCVLYMALYHNSNTASYSNTLTFHCNGPSMTITNVAEDQVFAGSNLNVCATPSESVSQVTFNISGQTDYWTATDTNGSNGWCNNFDISTIPPGRYVVEAQAIYQNFTIYDGVPIIIE